MFPHLTDRLRPVFAACCRGSLWIYLALVTLQSALLFFTYDNYPYAGISGTDGQAYYAFVRSAIIDHDLNFENEFYQFNCNRHGFQTHDFLPRSPHTGLIFNRYPIGFSLFLVPFFLAAHILTLLGNAVGLWNLPADGYSYLYQLAVPLNTLFWGGCAFWTTRKVLLRYFSFPVTASATFVFFLTYPGSFTIIWFWANNHLQSLLVFNLMLLLAFRVEERRDTFRTWAALGAAAAAGALLRTEYALFALFPALLLLSQCFGRKPALAPQRQLEDANPAPASQSGSPDILPLSQKKQDFLPSPLAEKGPGVRGLLGFGPEKNAHTFWTCLLPKALACAAAFLVVFFPQLLVWRLMWGRWGQMVMNNPSETFHWSHPVLLQLLFSTRHGLFYWSPVMLPTLCGFAALLATRRPRTVLLSAATLLLALHYVYASWAIWWMGYSFGARGFIALSTLFALGLGWLFQRFARHAWLLALLSAALILWNQAMIALFLTARIPRTEAFAPLLPFQKLLELASGLLGRLFH